ncbi:hypothetical protein [Kordia jejudonensis]|uniref:hypothetical protein n=1 Tax=Kordia jejudonensis TaxID=1348245 RepID=UPI00062916BE|nr:hypothetical protein [Kordia jejudonensis]
MNPLEKYRLSQDIFFSLQAKYSIRDIIRILHKYQIDIDTVNMYTQDEIKEILVNTVDDTVFSIANDLNITLANYKINYKNKKYAREEKEQKDTSNNLYTNIKNIFTLDNLINITIALLVPRLIFLLLKWSNENGGAAAITSLLKDISLNIGMEEGIGVFVFLGILAYVLSSYYVEKFFLYKIYNKRLKNNFLTQEVLDLIDTYPISTPLRQKLKSKYIFPSLKNNKNT